MPKIQFKHLKLAKTVKSLFVDSSALSPILIGLVVISVLFLQLVAPTQQTGKDVKSSSAIHHQTKVTTKTVVKPTPSAAPSTSPASTPVSTAPKSTVQPTSALPPASTPTPGTPVSSLTPTSSSSGGSSTSSSSSSSSSTTSPTSYKSENWAGYMADSGSFSAISAAWTAPDASAGGGGLSADATWIGIGGVSSSDLIQVGTQDTFTDGQVYTSAFYEMLPDASIDIPSITVHPGDSISASINETSQNEWSINIEDLSDGESYSTTATYNSTNSSAEWIEEDPSFSNGRLFTLDDFGEANFTDCKTTLNSSSQYISSITANPITMVSTSGQTEAVPSAISGNDFSVVRQ